MSVKKFNFQMKSQIAPKYANFEIDLFSKSIFLKLKIMMNIYII
jgi:hypothetical protein